MNRLNFVLPEWTRIAWAGQRARDVWEPRVAAISRAWSELSFLSVAEGLRGAQMELVAPEALPDLTRKAAARGLVVLPLSRVGQVPGGQPNGVYAARAGTFAPGQPWQYRTVVTAPHTIDTWLAASDDRECGRLLGYPSCCVEFFMQRWVDEAWMDTTYPMTLAGTNGPPECNILLRWLGLRLVQHLPCGFGCAATEEIGRRYYDLGVALGFDDEMRWLKEMLSWPVQWSALHGIAEIHTPVCRISTVTDATADKIVVQKVSDHYPDEGASGITFPFKLREVAPSSRPASAEWEDNGFSSLSAMLTAHRTVLEAAKRKPIAAGSVLDLGCGNGRLLEKVVRLGPGVRPFGVEVAKERAEDGRQRLGEGNVVQGDIADLALWPDTYSLCIVTPARLQELTEAGRGEVLGALRKRCSDLLVYAYGDRLQGGLKELAASCGMQLRYGEIVKGQDVEAARAEWSQDG